jgi:hypothetical protein
MPQQIYFIRTYRLRLLYGYVSLEGKKLQRSKIHLSKRDTSGNF